MLMTPDSIISDEVVALAVRADTGEDRVAAMRLGDVVDQLHDDHGLTDGTAKQTNLAASCIRRQQSTTVRDQNLGLGRLIGECRRRPVDRQAG